MRKSLTFFLTLGVYVLALGIGIYFRLYPLREHTSSEAKERATMVVLHQIKQNILENIQSMNPHQEAASQNYLAKKLFDEYLHKNGPAVRERIEETSEKLDPYIKEGRKTPYLLASDGYYFYSLSLNILEKGRIGDRIKGSKYHNPLMLAPNEHWEPLNLHPYIGVFVYQLLKPFAPSIDLMYAVSFTSLFLTALCLAVFLLIGRFLNVSPHLLFVSAIFFLLAPIFVKRSMFAWYDNDPYNILLPLLILYCLFQAFRWMAHPARRVVYALLTLASLGLYAYFWQGWVFLFCIVVLSFITYFLYLFLIDRDQQRLRQTLLIFGIIVIGDFFLVSALLGPHEFFILFKEGLTALRNFMSPQLSAWPDLFISVSELNESGWKFVTEQMGGIFFLVTAAAGFIYSFFSIKEKFIAILLFVYGCATLSIALGAQRFVILPLVPFSLAFALGLKGITVFSGKLIQKYSKNKMQPVIQILTGALLILTIYFPISWLNRSIPTLLNQIFNPTWEKSLVTIREKTPPESIVTTWWPPGHFIKAIARRAVTFDGATINVPQGYWLANFFLEENEMEALGILRMLNSGGNKAVEQFQSIGLELPLAVLAVNDLTMRSKDEARKILLTTFKNYGFTDQILSLTHGDPPPSYILIYNEFVENNLQLKFTGHHNFAEIAAINSDPKRLRAIPSRRSPQFIELLWQLAGGPHRYSGVLAFINRNQSKLQFQENVQIDTDNFSVLVDSPKYGRGIPQSIFFVKDGQIVEKDIPGANLSFSVLLFYRDDTPGAVLLDRSLAKSLLMKLYFFEGAGLKYIKAFTHERDLTGRTDIYVFEVDWAGFVGAADLQPLR